MLVGHISIVCFCFWHLLNFPSGSCMQRRKTRNLGLRWSQTVTHLIHQPFFLGSFSVKHKMFQDFLGWYSILRSGLKQPAVQVLTIRWFLPLPQKHLTRQTSSSVWRISNLVTNTKTNIFEISTLVNYWSNTNTNIGNIRIFD